ncbi:Mov34/MPN/PAD-1 family protein [Massilia sp. Root418]|uniref:Mov34/MPN/PAD-1 family protein n=1 Tax=Massilia sp. Root418 TaxID=1736532 RepID=UPI0009EAEE12|nr:Mov34/MPN/PAD-1 family protein [Massilia sp. Root418]
MLRITVPNDIQERLHLALMKAGDRECGGVLMGEHVGVNHFAVRELSLQKPGGIASFVRSLTGAVKAIQAFCRARGDNFTRFNYLGEWHSHPLFSVQPSSTDHATMRSLATDVKVGANFAVLLIFRLNSNCKLEGSAHTYLPDGSIYQSVLDLENVQ